MTGVVQSGRVMRGEPGEAVGGAITDSLEVPGAGARRNFLGNGNQGLEQAGGFFFDR